ncbi:hypothetical protein L227DRAFT_565156 [Lentinus tigrinus ALCF2SS1-6]|uniref:Uncharacterized protein n=1 Tax=Lentinus tigrinus ALCF2SS1-6 TaxID=1328759 RepID=A0A5C2S4W0_9APHY|nr:hypothetical protein L227DRAFT_565156 [Lentinus tigrinus ALCF2SS1-6]
MPEDRINAAAEEVAVTCHDNIGLSCVWGLGGRRTRKSPRSSALGTVDKIRPPLEDRCRGRHVIFVGDVVADVLRLAQHEARMFSSAPSKSLTSSIVCLTWMLNCYGRVIGTPPGEERIFEALQKAAVVCRRSGHRLRPEPYLCQSQFCASNPSLSNTKHETNEAFTIALVRVCYNSQRPNTCSLGLEDNSAMGSYGIDTPRGKAVAL